MNHPLPRGTTIRLDDDTLIITGLYEHSSRLAYRVARPGSTGDCGAIWLDAIEFEVIPTIREALIPDTWWIVHLPGGHTIHARIDTIHARIDTDGTWRTRSLNAQGDIGPWLTWGGDPAPASESLRLYVPSHPLPDMSPTVTIHRGSRWTRRNCPDFLALDIHPRDLPNPDLVRGYELRDGRPAFMSRIDEFLKFYTLAPTTRDCLIHDTWFRYDVEDAGWFEIHVNGDGTVFDQVIHIRAFINGGECVTASAGPGGWVQMTGPLTDEFIAGFVAVAPLDFPVKHDSEPENDAVYADVPLIAEQLDERPEPDVWVSPVKPPSLASILRPFMDLRKDIAEPEKENPDPLAWAIPGARLDWCSTENAGQIIRVDGDHPSSRRWLIEWENETRDWRGIEDMDACATPHIPTDRHRWSYHVGLPDGDDGWRLNICHHPDACIGSPLLHLDIAARDGEIVDVTATWDGSAREQD